MGRRTHPTERLSPRRPTRWCRRSRTRWRRRSSCCRRADAGRWCRTACQLVGALWRSMSAVHAASMSVPARKPPGREDRCSKWPRLCPREPSQSLSDRARPGRRLVAGSKSSRVLSCPLVTTKREARLAAATAGGALRDKDFGERADIARATLRNRCSIRLSYGAVQQQDSALRSAGKSGGHAVCLATCRVRFWRAESSWNEVWDLALILARVCELSRVHDSAPPIFSTQLSLRCAGSEKQNRCPSVPKSGREGVRDGASNRMRILGVPPAAGTLQRPTCPSSSTEPEPRRRCPLSC